MTAQQQESTPKRRLEKLRQPLVPERVRRIDGQGFAFILHRFLRDGFFQSLSRDQLALYIFLVLVGNRDGVSFFRYDAICSTLSFVLDDYIIARNALIDLDLIAFDGTRFQVLSLPHAPPPSRRAPLTTDEDFENHDPATINAIARASLESSSIR
jgi:hypothetical protein